MYGLHGIMAERQKVDPAQRYRPRELKAFVEGALRAYAGEMLEHADETVARWWRDFVNAKAWRVWNGQGV